MTGTIKTAVVTGGSRGIGLGVVKALLDQNFKVFSLSRNVCEELNDDRLVNIKCDVANEANQLDAFKQIRETTSRLDACFINAGVCGVSPLLEMDTDEWDRVLSTNLTGAFYSLREAGRLMRDSTFGGNIVACCSLSSFKPENMIVHYNASKAGLRMLVESGARELGLYNIRVNGIAPGLTKTDLIAGTESIPGYLERVAKRTPLGRIGEVADIIPSILHLLSDSWVSGQVLIADGGLSLVTPTDPLE